MKILKWLAFFFGTLATLAIAAMFWIGRISDALSVPIQLQSSTSVTREFRVQHNESYRIEVRCSRSIPDERLRKLLLEGNVLKIDLTQNGTPVQIDSFPELRFPPSMISIHHFGNLGFSRDWISQDIGTFRGERGQAYTIRFSVVRSIEELNVTNPTLLVALDPIAVESRIFVSFFLLAAGALSTVLSLVFASAHVRRRKRKQHPVKA